jgi:hypothetical protein
VQLAEKSNEIRKSPLADTASIIHYEDNGPRNWAASWGSECRDDNRIFLNINLFPSE